MVGGGVEPDGVPVAVWPEEAEINVFVSGDAATASWAMGLEGDLKWLVQGFAAGRGEHCRTILEDHLPRRDSASAGLLGGDTDVRFGMDCFPLDAESERELKDLIRLVIRHRIAPREKE